MLTWHYSFMKQLLLKTSGASLLAVSLFTASCGGSSEKLAEKPATVISTTTTTVLPAATSTPATVTTQTPATATQVPNTPKPSADTIIWNQSTASRSDGSPLPACGGDFKFTHPVADPDDINGVMFHPGGHVTPHEHMAYWNTKEPAQATRLIRTEQVLLTAPTDIFIVDFGWGLSGNDDEGRYLEWSGNLYACDGHNLMFGHVNQPTEQLLQILSKGMLMESMSGEPGCDLSGDDASASAGRVSCRKSLDVFVPAGTPLFYSSGYTSGFDFGLSLVGLTAEELSKHHPSNGFSITPWRSGSGNAVCPLEYFPEPWRSEYFALLLSKQCGPFNQDVPDTAMGLWFPTPSADQRPFSAWEAAPNEEFESIWLFAYHDDLSKHELSVPDDSFGLEYSYFVFTTRDEGTVNRRWDQITAGAIYCVELHRADSAFSHDPNPSAIALLEISADGLSLTIEGFNRTECAKDLNFGRQTRTFYR
jgi:hypothetical protein